MPNGFLLLWANERTDGWTGAEWVDAGVVGTYWL